MATHPSDLQPSKFKIKLREKEYWCNPPRMAHRIIILKVQPLFRALAALERGEDIDIDSDKVLGYQKDLDNLFEDLIPDLKKDNVTLNEEDLTTLIEQLVENSLPAESKELKEAKVEMNSDPKGARTD